VDETPRCPIILHFGRRDPTIPPATVEAIADAHPDIPIHLYDAGHGFVSDRRADYDPDAARLARLRTLQVSPSTAAVGAISDAATTQIGNLYWQASCQISIAKPTRWGSLSPPRVGGTHLSWGHSLLSAP